MSWHGWTGHRRNSSSSLIWILTKTRVKCSGKGTRIKAPTLTAVLRLEQPWAFRTTDCSPTYHFSAGYEGDPCLTLGFVRIQMGPVARIDIIKFSTKMSSGYNSNFESDIQVNPCKNRPSSPLKPCIEESSSPVSPTIVQCTAKSAEDEC